MNPIPYMFKSGVRVLMLINRGVNNTNKGSRRWINKTITSNIDEFEDAHEKLLDLMFYLDNPNIRLYQCINDRKFDNAVIMFQHRQLDLPQENKINFYSNINDRFCSTLMAPENKKSKYFLLDVDNDDSIEALKFIEDNDIEALLAYETPNGFHFIVEPFNVLLAKNAKTFEVKKDGLMLLNWL